MPITSTGKRHEEISQWDTAAKQGLPLREAVPVSICRKTYGLFQQKMIPFYLPVYAAKLCEAFLIS